MVFAGAVTGLALALLSMRYIASLVYEVKATDPAPLIFPALILFAAALPLRCCVQNRGDSPVSSHTGWRGNSTGPEMTARTAFSRVAGVNGFARHGASVPG